MTEFKLVGNAIETPLVNAAGSINGTNPEQILNEVEALASTAIGAITVGSFTILEQPGNEALFGGPMYHYDEETRTTYNAMGLPNIGLAQAKKLMPRIIERAHDRGKPVIASVVPTTEKDGIGDAITQAKTLVAEMKSAGADLVELNVSCPNIVTDGGRKPMLGYDYDGMSELVETLEPFADERVGLKLPPYLLDHEIIVPHLATLINDSKSFGFVVTSNTVPARRNPAALPRVPDGIGGISGPNMKRIGRNQLRMWRHYLSDDIEIISTLGVDNGKEMATRLELGAAAVGGVTFLWQKSNWGAAVTEMIDGWAQEMD